MLQCLQYYINNIIEQIFGFLGVTSSLRTLNVKHKTHGKKKAAKIY